MKRSDGQRLATTVGAFEAKNNLGQLLDRVARGEVIVITRHGTPVARLAPYRGELDRQRAREAAARLMCFGDQEGLRLPAGTTIRGLRDEGRA